MATYGHSKEKRSDCPLLTLALVLDGSGFVRRSEVLAGSIVEGEVLQEVLQRLAVPPGALIVMDCGAASEENLKWLREQGYRYLAVSLERTRQFDVAAALSLTTAGKQQIQVQKVVSEDGAEVRLYCYSEARKEKEQAMLKKACTRFEQHLKELHEGLSRPRTHKKIEAVWSRIGRLKANSSGAGQHYQIEVAADESGQKATAVSWERRPVAGSKLTHPGVYCLRSNQTDWDAEAMWRTYIMLTDLEAVFRSLKSELGLRPIYHQKQHRSNGHLFITVLAYQLVQVIRRRLREHGEHSSWHSLRSILAGQHRVTATFRRADGRVLHVRKATVAEPEQRALYALAASRRWSSPNGIHQFASECSATRQFSSKYFGSAVVGVDGGAEAGAELRGERVEPEMSFLGSARNRWTSSLPRPWVWPTWIQLAAR